MSSRGAFFEPADRVAHRFDGEVCLFAWHLAADVLGAVDEYAQHLLDRGPGVGADVARVLLRWLAALDEADRLRLSAVQAVELVGVSRIDDLHASVYRAEVPLATSGAPISP